MRVPKTKRTTRKSIPPTPTADTIQVKGKVVLKSLQSVSPNDWNPNRMTPHMQESLSYGLHTDGWLASQALLIWGKDDTIIPVSAGEAYQAAIPNSQLVLLDDCGHHPEIEQANAFVQHVQRFLQDA